MNAQKFDKKIPEFPLAVKIGSHRCGPDIPSLSVLEDGNQFVLDCLTNVNAIEEISKEWRELEQKCGEPYIYFQSFDWCLEWCKEFSNPHVQNKSVPLPAIKVYALHRNGDLVMVWPMMATKSATGLTIQTFLTEPHGQYGNIICDRKLIPASIGKRIWQHIKNNSDADAIVIDQYPQSSFLREMVESHGICECSERHSSVLDLTAFQTWDEYRASLSRRMRKQRNQRRNKITKLGNLGVETHYGGSDRYRELVAIALVWKKVWLDKTGRRAEVLSDESTKAFFSNLKGSKETGVSPPSGAVLNVLTLDHKPIGIEIGFCLDEHYYCYLGAFDWELKNYSPGKIQMEETQIWAKEKGFKKFDFLGEPADYKTSWTNSTCSLESRSVAITMRGFLYCVLWKVYLRPVTRYVFNKLKVENRTKLLALFGKGKTKTA